MQLTLVHIRPRKSSASGKADPRSHYEALTALYIDRIHHFHPCQAEIFPTEAEFLAWLTRPNKPGRTPALVVLLDSRGRQLSSDEFAHWLAARRDQGTQQIVFAIGPADGWSPTALATAHSGLLLSFGPITMPHELARLVLAEQLYRACTIHAGHPYHSGH